MSVTTLPEPTFERLPVLGLRGRLAGWIGGRPDDPAWVRRSVVALLVAHRGTVRVGPRRIGMGQNLLLGRGPGCREELGGAIPSAGPAGAGGVGRGPGGPGDGGALGGPGASRNPVVGLPRGQFGGGPNGGGGGGGGLLDGSTPSADLVALLDADSDHFTWVAATVDANRAAGHQLGTDDPVMAIGGFNASDPAPTLAEFRSYVSQGRIHYFIAGGMGGGSGAGSGEIASWVASSFTSTTVGGVTLYDLTSASV